MTKTILFMSLVAVLAWSVGLAQVANGESNGKTKTLEKWGIPKYDNMQVAQTHLYDYDGKPGLETVSISYASKTYAPEKGVVFEYYVVKDGKKKIYLLGFMEGSIKDKLKIYYDDNGDGKYREIARDGDVTIPSYLENYEQNPGKDFIFKTIFSTMYHKYNCSILLNSKHWVKFDSPQEARDSGGKPCEDCNP